MDCFLGFNRDSTAIALTRPEFRFAQIRSCQWHQDLLVNRWLSASKSQEPRAKSQEPPLRSDHCASDGFLCHAAGADVFDLAAVEDADAVRKQEDFVEVGGDQ